MIFIDFSKVFKFHQNISFHLQVQISFTSKLKMNNSKFLVKREYKEEVLIEFITSNLQKLMD